MDDIDDGDEKVHRFSHSWFFMVELETFIFPDSSLCTRWKAPHSNAEKNKIKKEGLDEDP